MELSPGAGIAAVVVLLAANGFFVAAEFAIVAVRKSRLEALANQGNHTARAALHQVKHLNTYIAACQLGITVASLLLGWIGEPALAHLIEPPLIALVGSFAAETVAHTVATVVALTIVTSLHIIVGEQAPKSFALQKPELTTLLVARPLSLFELIFRWPTWILQYLTNGLLRLLGLKPSTGHEAVHSVEELRMLVTGSQEAGVVEASEARIAARAFTFADLTASALMTPRTEVEAVSLASGFEQLMASVDATTRTRVPIYEGSLDRIVGILYVPDFYRAIRQNPPTPTLPFDLKPYLRPPMIVPESKAADDLLDEMRGNGSYFAVVIDEYGGTAGIVTLEDLVEALIGPMRPEGAAGDTYMPEPTQPSPDGSFELDGLTRLEEFEELTRIQLEEEDHEEVETLGGLFQARLGRIPTVGDEIHVKGRILRVEVLDGMRVERVRLLPRGATSQKSLDAPPST
ncbi:MAG TPA: hemolysin family protein [Chloroflexota bacterium]|nr:hemolysin family protein [Chloroflexota bacterium]